MKIPSRRTRGLCGDCRVHADDLGVDSVARRDTGVCRFVERAYLCRKTLKSVRPPSGGDPQAVAVHCRFPILESARDAPKSLNQQLNCAATSLVYSRSLLLIFSSSICFVKLFCCPGGHVWFRPRSRGQVRSVHYCSSSTQPRAWPILTFCPFSTLQCQPPRIWPCSSSFPDGASNTSTMVLPN